MPTTLPFLDDRAQGQYASQVTKTYGIDHQAKHIRRGLQKPRQADRQDDAKIGSPCSFTRFPNVFIPNYPRPSAMKALLSKRNCPKTSLLIDVPCGQWQEPVPT
jgi:hypothetical protein